MGGQRDSSMSVFVGNLGEVGQQDAEGMLRSMGMNPLRVRVLTDDQGRSKGAAFVDFGSMPEQQQALQCDGKMGQSGRRLRINPANQRPGGR